MYIAGPFVLIGSIAMTVVMNYSFQSLTGVEPDIGGIYNTLISSLGAMIFLLLASVALISVVYEYMMLYEKNDEGIVTVDEVFQKVKSSFMSVLGTLFLFVLLAIGIYIPLLIPTVIFSGISSSGFFFFIVFLLFFFGVMYFFVGSSLVFIIRAYEKIGFGRALGRSFTLIKGKWWSTFGLLLVIGLIQGVVSSIFIIPYYVNTFLATMHTIDTGELAQPSQSTLIINQVSLFFYFILTYALYALPLVGLAFQYFNLREMKEARGLIDKIDSFDDLSTDSTNEEHY